jgi:hypothetical protein
VAQTLDCRRSLSNSRRISSHLVCTIVHVSAIVFTSMYSAFVEASNTQQARFMETLKGMVLVRQINVFLDDWIQLFKVIISSTRCVNLEYDHSATPRFLISC